MCALAHARVCQSMGERERESDMRVGVGVWEAVIWCMGVGVKADRMRILIILVPHI